MQAKVDAEAAITHKFVVSKSGASMYKSYPVRWLMVVIGTFSTLAAVILFIIVFEKIYKPIQEKNAEKAASV
jgi:CBS domain containing-hemolysin-like protein